MSSLIDDTLNLTVGEHVVKDGFDASSQSYCPFPVDALPSHLAEFVNAGTKAIGCDASYIALPALAVCGAALGNTVRLELKGGWLVPPILWVCIVGDSGTSKSPAFSLVMEPLRQRQHAALRDSTGERFYVEDTTVEAIAPLMAANLRGLLLLRDELSGWFASFDRYSSGKGGGDAAHWLSMYNAGTMAVDRKTGNPKTISVANAALSICGGIQPGVLRRALGAEHRESGMAARFLMAYPPRRVKQWTDAEIQPHHVQAWAGIVDQLYGLPIDDKPIVVELSEAALCRYAEFYNRHNDELPHLSGDLASVWSKLEETAGRLALILHFVRWASGELSLADQDEVDEVSMVSAIRLVEWFKNESLRVYAMLGETDKEREERRLVEWIEGRGGNVSVSEFQRGPRSVRGPGIAKKELDRLVASGYGTWETDRFVLK